MKNYFKRWQQSGQEQENQRVKQAALDLGPGYNSYEELNASDLEPAMRKEK